MPERAREGSLVVEEDFPLPPDDINVNLSATQKLYSKLSFAYKNKLARAFLLLATLEVSMLSRFLLTCCPRVCSSLAGETMRSSSL